MKATILSADLADALRRISYITENRLTNVVNQTAKISVLNGVLSVSASNGVMDVTVSRACDSTQDGEFCVYPSMLMPMLQGENATLEMRSRRMHVTSGAVSASLATIPADQFIMHQYTYPSAVPVNLSALKINELVIDEDWKSTMLFDGQFVYATNGVIFARRPFAMGGGKRIAVDGKLIGRALSIISPKYFDDCKFSYNDNTIQLSAAGISVTITQSAEIKWPVHDMFGGTPTRRITVDRQSMNSALSIAVKTAMGEEPIADFSIVDGAASINVHSPLLDATYTLVASDIHNITKFSMHAKQAETLLTLLVQDDQYTFNFIGNYAIVNGDSIILMRGKPE